ncbi:MAG: sigma-54-dependent transcriptional regulator [Opitutaceae bacterium]
MKPEPADDLRILVVDDDAGQRSLLETFLRAQGFSTQAADSGSAALTLLERENFRLIISDVRMPGMSGIETLRRVREKRPDLPVLLVTAFADIRTAVAAMRDGAVNYLAKPIDLDELMTSVRRALGPESAALPAASPFPLPEGVIVRSPLMQSVFRDVAAIAPSDSRVLITGESGVGKEVVADVLHRWSRRAARPLVRCGCLAETEAALEVELFGREKGDGPARAGRFEEAAGGTLLLDEIADLPVGLQAKLLRVINEGVFRRVGSGRDITANFRLLASSRQDLEERIAAGLFREDLCYRLNVMEVAVPPLRERPEDVPALAAHFIGIHSGQRPRFPASVSAALGRYRWPGNVRELRNAMERAALLSRGEVVLPEHLPARVLETSAAAAGVGGEVADGQRLVEIEREAILRALRKNNFNRTETARELAISRRALTYKLQRLRAEGVPFDG